jgi:phosphoenolpyruvate-protein phosphotransferase
MPKGVEHKTGLPVSPGVAVARAYCLDEVLARREPGKLDAAAVTGEISRLDSAIAAADRELETLVARLTQQVGPDEAAIFHAHRSLLRDPALLGKVKSAIVDRQIDAHTALQDILDEYTALFARIPDEYLKERIADLRDVVQRIQTQLALQAVPAAPPVGPAPAPGDAIVLVAGEILPSTALAFERMRIAGILTEAGGATGHAAILARSLGIPAVSGLRGITREVQTGDLIALDGREGHVYLRPGAEVEAAYRKMEREYVNLRDSLIENVHLESVTADGVPVELLANVNVPADCEMAVRVGAAGVGLYRTEYLFLNHHGVPDEEEQYQAYRAIVETAPRKRVTIRTLDLGGDKQVPYFGHAQETNPFMGWRSIRISTAHPEFFQTQLRAILRAAKHGEVRLLFPMISTLEEVQRLKRLVRRTRLGLLRAGVPFGEDVPVGIMLEVPAAALCIDNLLEEVDFVSIGSNDLIQYLMAADRDNPKVAHLCEPFSPALYKVLNQVVKACLEQGKPVTLCGEMAGRPRCVLPLFGMGLRQLSMSPAFVPSIKEMVRRLTQAEAMETADRVLTLSTLGEIRGYLTRKIRQLWPTVTLLDMNR